MSPTQEAKLLAAKQILHHLLLLKAEQMTDNERTLALHLAYDVQIQDFLAKQLHSQKRKE